MLIKILSIILPTLCQQIIMKIIEYNQGIMSVTNK